MLTVPTLPVPAQNFSVQLGSQLCDITIRQRTTGVFLDLTVNGSFMLTSIRCLNRVRMVRDAYFGFIGDLAFFDTQGEEDPISTGLGSRFQLLYLEAADFAAAG